MAAVDPGLTMHKLKPNAEIAGISPAVLINLYIQPVDAVIIE